MPNHFRISLQTLATLALTSGLVACASEEPGEVASPTTETATSNTPSPELTTIAEPPTSEEITTTAAAPAAGDCSPATFARDVNPEFDVTLYCDGQWARTGKDRTDWIAYAYWDNGQWVQYPSDGTTTTGMSQPCYNLSSARANGAPEELLNVMPACG